MKLTLQMAGAEVSRSHDIPGLLDQVLAAFPPEAMPLGRHEFLERDKLFRELMEILGKFGGSGKYSALDAAVGRSAASDPDQPPLEMWEEMKLDILDDEWYDLLERDPAGFHVPYYPHLYEVVATSLARGIHSLWWLWAHGPTAEESRQWHPALTGAAGRRVTGLLLRSAS